jgi:hypothetical protein
MASSIVEYTSHQAYLLCEHGLHEMFKKKLNPKVIVHYNIFGRTNPNLEPLYEMDNILVINSDSYSFSHPEYWEGKTDHHPWVVDLARIKQMVFLYNFVISPSTGLARLSQKCSDVRIICANREWFHKMTQDNKYEKIRHLPRTTLDSPINPDSITIHRTPSDQIRIGKHSKAHSYKWNKDHRKLFEAIGAKYGNKIAWDFLGVPKECCADIVNIPHFTLREEYSIPVGQYLMGIDIFLFFINYNRSEPWSRAIGEALAAGIPVLATNHAGNKDQVIHGNNGFLCENYDDFYKYLCLLIENPELAYKMGRNGHIYSKAFTPQKVIQHYMDFISS